MSNLRFDSVMGRVTLGVRVKTDCFHFGCRFEYGFGLFGSGFGSRVYFARSIRTHSAVSCVEHCLGCMFIFDTKLMKIGLIPIVKKVSALFSWLKSSLI